MADHEVLPGEVRVLIVAQNPLARIGLSALLSREEAVRVVGESAPGDDLSDQIARTVPDALIWDAEDSTGLEALAAQAGGGPPIVALVIDSDSAADAWQNGARGVVPRTAPGAILAAAAQAVVAGLAAFDPGLARTLLPARAGAPREDLTAREQEVLQLMAEGLPNKVIGGKLGISENTVKFHVNAILSKLGVQSRTEAVVRAVRLGLILL